MKEKKKKTIRRELIEWGIIIFIGAFLYLTGLHTQVIGTLQGLVLKTGLMRPSTDEIIGQADYNFRLIDSKGNLVDGAEFKDQTVFINLWATWCPPCIAEMPDINNLYNEIEKDNIKFLIVSLDDEFDKAKKYVDKKGYDFEIYQFASNIPPAYSSQSIPTTIVLSPSGKIVVKREGMAKYNTESFREFLKNLK